MPITFINTTEDEFLRTKMLYRFFPLERALQCLEGRYLWFANPLEWHDPFERRYFNAIYNIKEYKSRLELPIKNRVVCLCLTKTYSCEAFWTVYARNDIGVGMSIDKRVLLEILNGLTDCEVYVGACNYMTTKNISNYPAAHPETINGIFNDPASVSQKLQMELLLQKRIAFDYEDEFRVILVRNRKSEAKVEKISFDGHKLISRLTLDPRIGPETERMMKKALFEKYGIPVAKSHIYTEYKPLEIKI